MANQKYFFYAIIISSMGKIAKYLNQLTVGNVFDNPEILEEYSTDRSALKIKPKFVAFPESTSDIRKLLKFFNQLATKKIEVSVTARGSGLDEGGAPLSNGIIISTKKLNKMLEIDPRERLVRVQAGITLRELNTALSVSGLMIPIDGREDETIGGLISNNPVDECYGKYGGISNYIERIEVVLANGECLQTERLKKYAVAKKAVEKTFEGELYRKISKILKENERTINELGRDNFDRTGYPGVARLARKETLDLMPLFFGAQGTLGIISEVILKAVPLRNPSTRVVATFKDIGTAVKYMETVKELKPRKLNLYDINIIMDARETGKNLDGIIRKLEDGYAVFCSFDERGNYYAKKIASLRDALPRTAKFIFESPQNKNTLNEFENSLTNYLNYVKNGERVPILTDFYLPSWNVASFLGDLRILQQKLDIDLELFGSFGASNYSLRPKFDLEDPDYRKKATTFLKAGAYIIDRQAGMLAGGTPEGRLKAVVTNDSLLESEKELYVKIKELFDKNGILNPDIKLGANSKFTLTHFRTTGLPKFMV